MIIIIFQMTDWLIGKHYNTLIFLIMCMSCSLTNMFYMCSAPPSPLPASHLPPNPPPTTTSLSCLDCLVLQEATHLYLCTQHTTQDKTTSCASNPSLHHITQVFLYTIILKMCHFVYCTDPIQDVSEEEEDEQQRRIISKDMLCATKKTVLLIGCLTLN